MSALPIALRESVATLSSCLHLPSGALRTRVSMRDYPHPDDISKLVSPMVASLLSFLREEDGPTTVEYAVMLSLILLVCMAGISAVGGQASSSFNESRDQLADKFDEAGVGN